MCGTLNSTMCKDAEDETIVSNPTDCKDKNVYSTFLYCVGEVPIITKCPNGSIWNETAYTCTTRNGEPVEVRAYGAWNENESPAFRAGTGVTLRNRHPLAG